MSELEEDTSDHWRWGLFYFNSKDKRILVPKRFGIGETFNFGHGISFVIMGLLIASVIVMLLYAWGVIKF